MWLGIDAALAALPVLLIGMGVKGAQIRQLLTQQIPAPDIFSNQPNLILLPCIIWLFIFIC